MRKIIVSNNVTLDGFFAGPNGELDWKVWDDEIAQYAKDQSASTDTILFGRVTYELMSSYWPTPAANSQDPVILAFMNNSHKIVFSKTLARADWKNTEVVKDINAKEILRMKQEPGKDMIVFGSGSVVSALSQHGLIDDYRIFVTPVVLGRGKRLFQGIMVRMNLKLLDTKRFNNGVVLLHYKPGDKKEEPR
ncbi:MAG: dihydrofolate reductase family protein [Thermodesulfobacteriota bacterium]